MCLDLAFPWQASSVRQGLPLLVTPLRQQTAQTLQDITPTVAAYLMALTHQLNTIFLEVSTLPLLRCLTRPTLAAITHHHDCCGAPGPALQLWGSRLPRGTAGTWRWNRKQPRWVSQLCLNWLIYERYNWQTTYFISR